MAGEEVDDGSEEIELPEPQKGEGDKTEEGEEPEPVKASGRLAEGGEGEEGGESAEGGTDADGKPLRPKKTSKQRRDERRSTERRVREERDFLLSQNREILERLAQVESSGLDSRLLVVDSKLNECLNDAAQAEALEVEALAAKNTQEALQFRKVSQAARGKANFLEQEKTRLAQVQAASKSRPPQPAPAPGAAEVVAHAARYRADKAWLQFDQKGAPANAETAVALSIDIALQREGELSERDASYWQELDKRVKSALPRLFGAENEGADDDEDDVFVEPAVQQRTQAKPAVKQAAAAASRKGPAVGSSGTQSSAAGTYRLSRDRIDALKEIGEWETPKQQKEWADHYRKWDKEHGNQ